MQATVASYEASTAVGTVVTDAGLVLPFGSGTLAEHIRHLRPGQRVHVDVHGDVVTAVRIWG